MKADDTLRAVQVVRTTAGAYEARNARGGTIPVGGGGDQFTAVELLLVAIGACTAADVDLVVSRRAEPQSFTVEVSGHKVKDGSGGNRMVDLRVEFAVELPAGDAGDAARAVLPRMVKTSHDRLCTVSRTVELGTAITAVP